MRGNRRVWSRNARRDGSAENRLRWAGAGEACSWSSLYNGCSHATCKFAKGRANTQEFPNSAEARGVKVTILEALRERGRARPRRRVEERSACRPLLHHRSARHGVTWTSRAGSTPLPSREL